MLQRHQAAGKEGAKVCFLGFAGFLYSHVLSCWFSVFLRSLITWRKKLAAEYKEHLAKSKENGHEAEEDEGSKFIRLT